MIGRLRALVGGRRPTVAPAVTDDALPHEVAAILAGVSFSERSTDPETGAPRILVMLPNGGAIRYGSDTASTWLRERFGLNDSQVKRALQVLRARLAEWQRMQATAAVEHNERWADWKPIRSV